MTKHKKFKITKASMHARCGGECLCYIAGQIAVITWMKNESIKL